MNFQMFKLDLEKAEEPESKLPTSIGSLKKQESSRKISTFALLTMPKPLTLWITINWKILKEIGIPDHLTCLLRNLYEGQEATEFQKSTYLWFIDYDKAFDCVDHNKLWKILKELGIPDHLTCSSEICMQVRKQQLELDMEQQTGSKSGKEYVKAVYCHPVYLTYM